LAVTTNTPFFSILIPSYNRPDTIAECVESVLANKEKDFEIIVSDDASPAVDAIEQALRPYLRQSNIQFHRQATNVGEPANRNALVARARGRYNIILCDDDKLLPHALSTIRDHIETRPDHDLYMFGYQVISAWGRPRYDRVAPGPLTISLEQSDLVRRMFEATWLPFLICHPSTFCCKRGVETQIPYRVDVSIADDYMFLLECVNKGKRLYIVPERLMQYRWTEATGETKTNQSSDNLKVLNAFVKVYYAIQKERALHPSIEGIVRSQDYRKRFLYDLIIRRKLGDSIVRLGLMPAHREELAEYVPNRSTCSVLLTTASVVVRDLTQLFGLKGFLYSIQTGFAFLRHRVLLG
jgi:glycosyltransferase involved in cell wall biosynthesis